MSGSPDERLFEAIHLRLGLKDGAVLRQCEIDENFRAIRIGKELLLHEGHAEYRDGQHRHADADRDPGTPHRADEDRIEKPYETAGIGRIVRRKGLRQHRDADQWREDHRNEP